MEYLILKGWKNTYTMSTRSIAEKKWHFMRQSFPWEHPTLFISHQQQQQTSHFTDFISYLFIFKCILLMLHPLISEFVQQQQANPKRDFVDHFDDVSHEFPEIQNCIFMSWALKTFFQFSEFLRHILMSWNVLLPFQFCIQVSSTCNSYITKNLMLLFMLKNIIIGGLRLGPTYYRLWHTLS